MVCSTKYGVCTRVSIYPYARTSTTPLRRTPGMRLEILQERTLCDCRPHVHRDKHYCRAVTVGHDECLGVLSWMVFYLTFQQSHFAEGLGSPPMDHTLCSTALRLALAKRLHRALAPSSNMSEAERQMCSLLFWAIYSYEKHVTLRPRWPSVSFPSLTG